MKKTLYFVFLLSLMAIIGCDSNPTAPETGGLGTGTGNGTGNGNGTVSIQVQGQQDGQGNYIFSLKPSVDVTLTSVTASVVAEDYTENFDFTGQGQWQAANYVGFLAYPENLIQQGQAWTFKYVGKTINDNKDFAITVNYMVP